MIVKNGSRRERICQFAVLAVAFLLSLPEIARADRVVLYPVTGRADPERLEHVEDELAAAIRDLGHEVLAPPGGLGVDRRPNTAAELGGVATASSAMYVVLAEVEPLRAQYRLHVRVGYQPSERAEDLVVTVMEAEERARIREVLSAMLRPAGLGEDALRLTGETDSASDDAARREEEERARAEAELAAQRETEERAAREAEEARQAQERAQAEAQERERWNSRPLYGSDGRWLIAIGGGASYAVAFGDRPVIRDGMVAGRTSEIGGLGRIQARAGYAFSGLDGLELRGGLDVVLGAVGGLDVVVGGTWQFSPFLEPIRIGPLVELGASFTFTGAQNAGFLVRAGALVSWAPIPQLQIELSPDVAFLTNSPGAFMFGGSLRVGYRL
jgi:hypothetical protein